VASADALTLSFLFAFRKKCHLLGSYLPTRFARRSGGPVDDLPEPVSSPTNEVIIADDFIGAEFGGAN
jgi:hypothetical protein